MQLTQMFIDIIQFPPPPPNTSPRKSKEVLKALLIRAFFGFTTTPLNPIRPGGAGDYSAVGTAASPTTSHLPSCFWKTCMLAWGSDPAVVCTITAMSVLRNFTWYPSTT